MRADVNCEHQVKTNSENLFLCKIGMYGGHPYIGNCVSCIRNNQNNPEYANEIAIKHRKSHPENAGKVSGCCDSALNYR
jgi:hypothetical protein